MKHRKHWLLFVGLLVLSVWWFVHEGSGEQTPLREVTAAAEKPAIQMVSQPPVRPAQQQALRSLPASQPITRQGQSLSTQSGSPAGPIAAAAPSGMPTVEKEPMASNGLGSRGLGARAPNAKEQAWMDDNLIVVQKVHLNRLGLERLNTERTAQGKRPLQAAEVNLAEDDQMVAGQTRTGSKTMEIKSLFAPATPEAPATPSTSSPLSQVRGKAAATASALSILSSGDAATSPSTLSPANVDNSSTAWFPPIGNQGDQGSCMFFSSVYYVMTYMVAKANNWDVRSGPANRIFSPQFAYNMMNLGDPNAGGYTGSSFWCLQTFGSPFLSAWPYGDPKKLPATAKIWRDAMAYRMGQAGVVEKLDTPAGLANLKAMLANGYILNMMLDIYGWHWKKIGVNPLPGADNSLAGWPVVAYADSVSGGPHGMTIVGYNDNAWCDINGNGVVDAGELGAFKVCNQWGTTWPYASNWNNNGFAYVSYDSLQLVSSIPGATNTDRQRSFKENNAKWIQAGPVGYKPTLIAECSLTTADRASTVFNIGFSDQLPPPAQLALNPWNFAESGKLSFDGTTTPSAAVVAFDLTDIAEGGRRRFWQLALSNGANSSTLTNFVLTDGTGNPMATLLGTLPAGGLPQTTSIGTTLSAWVDGFVAPILPRIQWSQAAYVVNETGGSARLTLKRSDNPLGVVTVNYATKPGTALAPDDFSAQTGAVTWADGDLADKTISIPVGTDTLVEGTEQFTVTLNGLTGATLLNTDTTTVSLCDTAGVRDDSFNWNLMYSVNVGRLFVQPDGNVLLAGTFPSLTDLSYGVRNHGRVSRILPSGQPDPGFNPGSGANLKISALARQPDGKILIGGNFTSYNGTARQYLARLNTYGSLDSSFDPGVGPNSGVNDILVQPDGKILIGGAFTTVQGEPAQGLARLNADGSLDTSFSTRTFPGLVNTHKIALQPDGKILAAGQISCAGVVGVGSKCGLARFNADGTRDATFDVGYGAITSTGGSALVYECTLQADGKILVGGTFKFFGGQAHSGVARINSDGSVDSSFSPSVDDTVSALLLQPDGKILIGGSFLQVNSSTVSRIARLNPDGTLDTAFSIPGGVNKPLTDFALQPDGNILFSCSEAANYQASSYTEAIWRLVAGFPGLPGTLQISTPTVTAIKGTSVQLTVTRTGGGLGALKVGYATVPGSATTADFTQTSGFLSWASGDSTPKTITVPTSASGPAVSGASFMVNLAAPINASVILGDQQQAVVTLQAGFASWQAQQFTAAESANLAISGPTADPDRDGVTNLLEYAFGFKPKTANSAAQPLVGTVTINGVDYLTLAYRRLVPTSPDLTYTPQATGDLAGVWAETPVLLSGPVANGDGTETVTYRDATPLTGAAKRFLRLKVTQQP